MLTLRTLFPRWSGSTHTGEAASANASRIRVASVVWILWAVGLVWTAVFVARHGHNLPAYDEWAFVKISYASRAEQVEWLGERHMEHRFPLARIIFLGLLDVSGHDFRPGMWVSFGLLAATAATLILAARCVRGHTALADAMFPVLFLHAGQTENLLMGYQIAFTISVFALGLFALVAVRSGEIPPGRAAAWGAVCLVTLALGGWMGLVFVPSVGAWVAWQVWRTPGDRMRRFAVGTVVIGVAGYLAWSGWKLCEPQAGTGQAEALGLGKRIRAIAEVTGIGLGPGISYFMGVRAAGWVLLGLQAVIAYFLARLGWRQREERAIAWGLLALLFGVWTFALGIGYSRGSGLASRYTSFAALGVAIPFLVLARYAPRATLPAGLIAILSAGFLFPCNFKHGAHEGVLLDERYRSIQSDIKSGMPIDVLARRHMDFWLGPQQGWRELWAHGFPLLRVVPGPEERVMLPAAFQRDGERAEALVAFPNLPFARYRVELGGEKQVSVLRVKFHSHVQVPWEPMRFVWIDPATGQKRCSVVRPWTVPLNQHTMFWIDGPLNSGELLLGRTKCPIDVLSVEYNLKRTP